MHTDTMNANGSAPVLKVPMEELVGRPKLATEEKKKRHKRHRPHAGVRPAGLEIFADYGSLGLTQKEFLRKMRRRFSDYTDGASQVLLWTLKKTGQIEHDKLSRVYYLKGMKPAVTASDSTDRLAPPKVAQRRSRVVKVRLKPDAAPVKTPELSDVNDAVRVVEAALKQVEEAGNALKILAGSIIERANRIEQIKKDLASV